jgi:hypothetical protein
MKYYLWVDAHDQPLTQALAYEDEIERMMEEDDPPPGAVILRVGTKDELKVRYGLDENQFVGG